MKTELGTSVYSSKHSSLAVLEDVRADFQGKGTYRKRHDNLTASSLALSCRCQILVKVPHYHYESKVYDIYSKCRNDEVVHASRNSFWIPHKT
jgi:hypothetical protein